MGKKFKQKGLLKHFISCLTNFKLVWAPKVIFFEKIEYIFKGYKTNVAVPPLKNGQINAFSPHQGIKNEYTGSLKSI